MIDTISKALENGMEQDLPLPDSSCDSLQKILTFFKCALAFCFACLTIIALVILLVSIAPKSTKVTRRTCKIKMDSDTQINEEDKLKILEGRISRLEKSVCWSKSKHYPEVTFLPDKDRKRILITGGAGFIGSHLTDRLMVDGHEVTVVDNFSSGRKKNIEQWIGHENFKLIHHDIFNPLDIEVDQIYHLASPSSPTHYMDNPIRTIKTNTEGTINVLGLAKRVGARVLMATTSEVYGDPEVHPQSETDMGHVNPDEVKRVFETWSHVIEVMTQSFAKQENVEVRVVRIFNTFGPRMPVNEGRVVRSFVLQALQDEPITVCGSGNRTQSFQYVPDLVEGLIRLMNSDSKEPVNLGNPEEQSVNTDKVEDDPQGHKPDMRD